MTSHRSLLVALITGSVLLTLTSSAAMLAQDASSTPAPSPVKGPLSPEESLKHLVLADPNLVIELVAAEPEVIDPVSLQFDEHGRLWVVEMRDYPTGPQHAPPPLGGPDAKPLSRIKLLEDKDGDGRFETAHVFADNLLFATGVQPWDGGVIVTLAGEVAYFKDTDGDHKADLRETWFTGFAQANTQLRANHPTFGPDGWIYVANGLRGGNVIAVKKDWPVKAEGLGVRGQGLEKSKTQPSSSPPHLVTPSPLQSTGVSHDPAKPVPVSLTGRDFKFDPLTGRYEAISGNGQFGMTFDAWGNRFVCDNRHPCRHVIFEEDFIRRCPHVAFPAVVHDVIPPDDKNKVFPLTSAWTTSNLHAGTFTASCGVTVYTGDWLPQDYRGNVFVCEPTGNLVQRAVLEPDGVTFKSRNPHERPAAQSSRHVPRDEPSKRDSRTASDGASDINSERLVTRNVTATETQEFLASRDDWFRPVDLQNGPDGALYVVDMYRAVIEHPEWVPDELKNRPDTWLGNDKGRIYRIRDKRKLAFRPDVAARPRLEKLRATPFYYLNDDNELGGGWYRLTASRLLHEHLIRESGITSLKSQLQELEASEFEVRGEFTASLCSSIWASPRLSELLPGFAALRALNSRNAPQLDRLILRRLTANVLDESADRATHDRSAAIALQFLFKSGADDLQVIQTWHALAPSSGARSDFIASHFGGAIDDPWVRLAMIGSVAESAPDFLFALIELKAHRFSHCASSPTGCRGGEGIDAWGGLAEMFFAIGEQVGKYGTHADLARSITLLSLASAEDLTGFGEGINSFQIAASGLLGIAKGTSQRRDELNRPLDKFSPDSAEALAKLATKAILNGQAVNQDDDGEKVRDRQKWRAVFKGEAVEQDDPDLSLPRRRIAIRLLPHLKDDKAFEILKQLAESESNQTLRLTAVESFASVRRPEVDAWLIERYRSETPAIRRAILAALLVPKERQLALLGAIAEGRIAATEIDPVRAKQLTESKDEAVREKAKQVLAAAAPASRKEVLEAYQPALTLKADPQRGREVFQKNCVTCHRVGELGVNVAPDISDTRTKKPEQLLLDILDPNRAIDANYFAYAVVTKEGKTESGVIAAETSNSITLKQPEGKVLTLLRSDIDELRNTGLSLMPVGVEKNINPQQMADLIFWLKNWRYLDGKVPATSLK